MDQKFDVKSKLCSDVSFILYFKRKWVTFERCATYCQCLKVLNPNSDNTEIKIQIFWDVMLSCSASNS